MSSTKEKKAGPLTHLLFVLCIVLCGSFIYWATVAKLDIVSVAPGRVAPSGRIKEVQHLEGGIIEEILVEEGDAVKEGDTLLVLQGISSDATVGELEVRIAALRVELLRLEAMSRCEKSFAMPEDLNKSYPALVDQGRLLFEAKIQRYEAGLAARNETIAQRTRDIEQIKERMAGNRENLELLRKQIAISEKLILDKLTTEYEHLQFLREEAALKSALLEDKSNLAKAQSALREAEDNKVHYDNSFRVEVQEKRTKAQQELSEFSHRMKKFNDNLRRTSIKAPVDGIVKTLYVDTRGGVVAPGRTILDIVPTGDSLIVEAQLSIEDITSVKPGQDAVVKLASRNARRVGKISGQVVHISPDAMATEQGLTYYATRIKTNKDYFIWGEEHYQLIPGMGVAVFIHTGKRTVLEYLLDPFLESLSQGFKEK
ncbi:MAG: HlyD family type I secretion periplasmic adaptor subunit [Desulfofustis sp.]|nr:HlyD family type I secretion periplasmic adaptor subunit [Desulfofustis sp.]